MGARGLLLIAPLVGAAHLAFNGSPLRVTRTTWPCLRMAADADLDAVKAMATADIKAELELRGVDATQIFEKEDLARRLVLARTQGEADPSIIDTFNSERLERSLAEDSLDVEPDVDVLPGGMSTEMVKKLSQNPQLMAVLQNSKMQEVLKEVMEFGPVAFAKYQSDADVMQMITLFQETLADEKGDGPS